MKHRKLRIAWSVAWGIVAVLLVALWVRSYWVGDNIDMRRFGLASARGVAGVEWGQEMPSQRTAWSTWAPDLKIGDKSLSFTARDGEILVAVPIWLLATVSATCAGVPWSRFSLRTVLIATTLAAVGLGLIVWLR